MTLIQILESRGEALTVQEVAEVLGVSDKHIYEMVADGTLPAFYVGRSVRLDPQDIADWLRKKKLPVVQARDQKRPQKRPVLNRNGHGSGNSAVHNALRRKAQHLEAAAVIDGVTNGQGLDKTAEKS
ncbi:MAG: helix-turn-helix domain-containing protein [Acidobacteriia bacterium]|nr:helix-turn-helix domain-containing protein [Terriglobia bacterium]